MAKVEALAGGGKAVHMSREERRGKRKKLHRLEVSRAKNGGHVVKHHFAHAPDVPFQEPQEHVFGKQDGAALMAHLGRHLGVRAMPGAPEPGAEGPMAGAAQPPMPLPDDEEEA